MTADRVDPSEFKATQREAWGIVAEGWRKWWRVFEDGAQHLNERLVELADVRHGHRVLDIAAGSGEPALTAARAVGAEGRVLATDLAPEMLAVAQDRAREHGVRNVEFREMDAERLELEPGSFDAAVCRWGLMLMMDPVAAARGVRAALKPGARFAAAVWGERERAPFLAIPYEVSVRVLATPEPPAGTPGAFAMARAGRLEEVLVEGGFGELRSETRTVTFEFASPREYARFVGEVSWTMRTALEGQPAEVSQRVWREVEREAERYQGSSGRVRLENTVRCVSGGR